MSDLRVALIGYGYWGPNLLRNFNEIEGASMVACSDLSRRPAGQDSEAQSRCCLDAEL